mmetsp:Transcript_38497/g.95601  ORF Transcript_38497/g.95601 Transcript_38497/m.95601 type:complete len:229 (+) Transcript_38497:166-852(+)
MSQRLASTANVYIPARAGLLYFRKVARLSNAPLSARISDDSTIPAAAAPVAGPLSSPCSPCAHSGYPRRVRAHSCVSTLLARSSRWRIAFEPGPSISAVMTAHASSSDPSISSSPSPPPPGASGSSPRLNRSASASSDLVVTASWHHSIAFSPTPSAVTRTVVSPGVMPTAPSSERRASRCDRGSAADSLSASSAAASSNASSASAQNASPGKSATSSPAVAATATKP